MKKIDLCLCHVDFDGSKDLNLPRMISSNHHKILMKISLGA